MNKEKFNPIVCLKCGGKEFEMKVEGKYRGRVLARVPSFDKLHNKWVIDDVIDWDDVEFDEWNFDECDDVWKCIECDNSTDFLYCEEYIEAEKNNTIEYTNKNQLRLFDEGVEGKTVMIINGKRVDCDF